MKISQNDTEKLLGQRSNRTREREGGGSKKDFSSRSNFNVSHSVKKGRLKISNLESSFGSKFKSERSNLKSFSYLNNHEDRNEINESSGFSLPNRSADVLNAIVNVQRGNSRYFNNKSEDIDSRYIKDINSIEQAHKNKNVDMHILRTKLMTIHEYSKTNEMNDLNALVISPSDSFVELDVINIQNEHPSFNVSFIL